jgi:chromate reductase
MSAFKVGYFVGSLAKESINRKLALALTRLAPAELRMREIPIGDLPLYSYDYDPDYPPPARALKDAIAAVDAVLFVTPEYNRSIPGGLKNAIDWASRPWGQNSFTRKPSAIIGTSPGKIGTAVAQQHLRSILAFCNSPLMNAIDWASRPYGKNAFARKPSGIIGTSPGKIGTAIAQQHLRSILAFCNSPLMNSLEAYVQFAPGLITAEGQVTDASTEQFLRQYIEEFAGFIARVYTALPRNQ